MELESREGRCQAAEGPWTDLLDNYPAWVAYRQWYQPIPAWRSPYAGMATWCSRKPPELALASRPSAAVIDRNDHFKYSNIPSHTGGYPGHITCTYANLTRFFAALLRRDTRLLNADSHRQQRHRHCDIKAGEQGCGLGVFLDKIADTDPVEDGAALEVIDNSTLEIAALVTTEAQDHMASYGSSPMVASPPE
jgi:hypothetical protein